MSPIDEQYAVGDQQNDVSSLVELGKLLRSKREAMHLSQRTVAERAGISPAYVRVLETGENVKTGRPSRPSPDRLAALCQVLDLDIRKTFGLAGLRVDDETTAASQRVSAARGATSEAISNIQAAFDSIADRGPFMAAQMQSRLRRFSLEMGRMGRGVLRVDAEQEGAVSADAARTCNQHFRAVSFQDEDFWKGDDGDDYLELQEELRSRDVEITRVFLFSEDDLRKYRKTFERHLELGIMAFVLKAADVPAVLQNDIVIYDDALMRRALSPDIEGGGKAVEFTDDFATVQQALYDFEQLLEIAYRTRDATLNDVLRDIGGEA